MKNIIKNFKALFYKKEALPKIKPLEIASIHNVYGKIGYPKKIGTKIQAKMRSGKIAVYELTDIEHAWNVDWSWYNFSFSHYKRDKECDYPKYC